MIYDGALAADGDLLHRTLGMVPASSAFSSLSGSLSASQTSAKLNTVAMALLFLTDDRTLPRHLFQQGNCSPAVPDAAMTFGAAVELAQLPCRFPGLPLISDYTREAKEPVKATAVSAVVYGLVSCWMYIIGMGASLFTGESDIAQILMVKAGLEYCRAADHRIFHRHDHVPGRLLCRNLQRICPSKAERQPCGHRSDHHRNRWRYPVSRWMTSPISSI